MEQKIYNLIEPISTYFRKKPISKSILVFYNNSSQLYTVKFPIPITLNDYDLEIALVNLETWYSFANITLANNNFKYSIDGGNTWKLIILEIGAYQIEAINDEIQRLMKINGDWDSASNAFYITLSPNTSTLKSIIDITNSEYKVDFTIPNSLRSVLGFDSIVLSKGYNASQGIVNIIEFNSIFVNCDCITESFVNGIQSLLYINLVSRLYLVFELWNHRLILFIYH